MVIPPRIEECSMHFESVLKNKIVIEDDPVEQGPIAAVEVRVVKIHVDPGLYVSVFSTLPNPKTGFSHWGAMIPCLFTRSGMPILKAVNSSPMPLNFRTPPIKTAWTRMSTSITSGDFATEGPFM